MGRPLEEILRILRLPKAMADTYRAESRAAMSLAALFEGVPQMLDSAREKGYRLGLMTGKDRTRTEEVLDQFAIAQVFEATLCGDDPHPAKPEPAGLIWLLGQLRARSPAESVMIGDSPLDITCARRAGVFAVGANWGFSSERALVRAGAALTFASPLALELWLCAGAGDEPGATVSRASAGVPYSGARRG